MVPEEAEVHARGRTDIRTTLAIDAQHVEERERAAAEAMHDPFRPHVRLASRDERAMDAGAEEPVDALTPPDQDLRVGATGLEPVTSAV